MAEIFLPEKLRDVEPVRSVRTPRPKAPLDRPFAWALIKPDGADTSMLGAVDAGSIDAMSTGMAVEPVWADEREGSITDLAHWRPVGG